MSHPRINNKTPFTVEPLFLTDEDGQPLLVPVVKGTLVIKENNLPLAVTEKQIPVEMVGEHWGDPETSSYKYEPETAVEKPCTDVVLIGHAYPEKDGDTETLVDFQLGKLRKMVRVTGDRKWVKVLGAITATDPEPFEKIPLTYDRAFGGWDRSNEDPDKHSFEPRNPCGVGYFGKSGKFKEGTPLPNLEDPSHPIRSHEYKPPPAGFGFTSPNWEPRYKLAGTYDKKWMETRQPLLPKDFNRKFFNAASPGLIANGILNGDEQVRVVNASPNHELSFQLPGFPSPEICVRTRDENEHHLTTKMDTVIVNTDEFQVYLIWRANLALRTGPHDVREIEIGPITFPLNRN